ncbi:(2Fe-2S)-binding protein [Desulfurococcus mucosus]|uniref:(2Fe-2S)-binding domain-containing protein n=1 Tax=Desulfurococcus mucosus (strain ATCC 35584 / DSM 2162 / JCM 9187 / O7/1) TaxID=765177 RepID=E8R8L2_DESM0|nr:(2Fe-2S)-binding protein [Desulfurococcus mucosus]ADV64838.1 (2Fe-2S)-binding domain-containing protein [Desulfurococcus mucosus DSM 2162]
MKVSFRVNGKPVELDVEPNELLINTLRNRLGLTGVKYGCGIGECGACTVLIDGEPALSCLVLTVDVNGREVETVEGLTSEREPSPVQKAFMEEGAVQCGYCTPGFIVMAEYMRRRRVEPSDENIREYLKGNLCRCTGYVNIYKAVRRALQQDPRGSPDDSKG